MTAEPVRIIQVGAGGHARTWLKVLSSTPGVELVGLADLNLDTAREAAQATGHTGVPVATSLTDLLSHIDAEAVINVTVPTAHAVVNTTALLAGLPTLCEKPAADTVAAALSMVAAAEVSGRLLMISQSRRYFRNLDAFRGQLTGLGELGLAECRFYKAVHFPGFREEMANPLLIDMAIHQFDLARDLIGSEPMWISCQSYNPAWSWFAGDASATLHAEFANGTRFVYSGSWCTPGLETSWNGAWRITGPGGTATWDGAGLPVAELADGTNLPASPGDGPEEVAGSLAEFLNAVRTSTSPASGEIHSNIISLAMVEAAVQSAETGRRVEITELLESARQEAIAAESRPELLDTMASWPPGYPLTLSAVLAPGQLATP